MKKFAVLVAVLVLGAIAFLGFRYYQAAERLRSIAGGEYRALGFKLILAKPQSGVKGLFRLQPYVEIPQVSLEASEWGGKLPLQLGKGRLKAGLWDSAGLRLVLDAGNAASGEVEFERLAFELALPDQILSISAESLRFPGKIAESGQSLSLKEPWLQLRPGESKIPSQMNFRFQALTWEDRKVPDQRERLQIGTTEFGYVLSPEGSEWKWRAHFHSKGLATEGREIRGDVAHWTFGAEGIAVRWDESVKSRWLELWRALPETPEGKIPALPSLFSELRPRVDHLEFRWGGFDIKEGPKWSAKLEPVEFSVRYLPEAQGYGWKLLGQSRSLTFAGEERRLEVGAMNFEESLGYRGLTYDAWVRLAIDYYSAFYASQSGAANIPPAKIYLPYLAHLPDTMQAKLKLERLTWVTPDYRSEHRGLEFTFDGQAERWDYRMVGSFDSQSKSSFPPNIKNGKIDFDFGFPLPYRELLQAARAQPESGPSGDFLAPFADKEAGLDWKWQMDLGSESFGLNASLLAKTRIDSWLSTLALFGAFHREKPADSAQLLKTAKVDFHLKIERLSKLQFVMDQIQSGSSMALGLAGAYVVVDPKADSLKFDFKLEDGEIFLNGQRSPSLETRLKEKIGAVQ